MRLTGTLEGSLAGGLLEVDVVADAGAAGDSCPPEDEPGE